MLHVLGVLHDSALTSRITRKMRVGKRTRDGRKLLQTRPKHARPATGEGPHFTTCRDPMGTDHSILTLPSREKRWKVMTTSVWENTVDPQDRTCMSLYTTIPQTFSSPKSPERMARKTGKVKEMRPRVVSSLPVGTTATSITDAWITLKASQGRDRGIQ